jgi:glycerophosphoryl diester phosphodiesterase
MGTGAGRRALVTAIFISLIGAPTAQASLEPDFIQAHRGGTLATVKGKQKPVYGEETMPAFKAAAAAGYVLEFDVKLSADGVPMVIHDATLDRTTACEGQVSQRTAREIVDDCPVDVLGTAGVTKRLGPNSKKLSKVPTLTKVLRFAAGAGAIANIEIKNVPTDPDFDTGRGYTARVLETIEASGFPVQSLILQSFWPPNLAQVQEDPYFDGAEISYLTLQNATNESGPTFAQSQGFQWVSPEWPVGQAYVDEAQGRGLRVVPYTLNRRSEVAEATRFGVDAVITDDPGMALRAAAGALAG